MAKSRQDLVNQALFNLGVLVIGQNAGAEEYNLVDGIVDPMLEELIGRDIVFVQDVDAIEDRYFLSLGHVLAGQAASLFGMQNDQALAARMIKGEKDLRVLSAMRPTYETLEVQAY